MKKRAISHEVVFVAILCTLTGFSSTAHGSCYGRISRFAASLIDVSRDRVPTLESLFKQIDLFASWKINHLESMYNTGL